MNSIKLEDFENILKSNIGIDKMRGKTILFTGANGFIPAYMIEALLYFNDIMDGEVNIVALVRNKKKAKKRFSDYTERPDLSFIIQDVCEPLYISKKVNYIIHAASQASPKYYGVDPVGTLKANVIGTYNLLEFARKHKVEGFLYFSSGEVYGAVDDSHIPTKEDEYGYLDPDNIRSCYAESKRMAENMCISWWHQFGVPIKIVRPFHTYGPGMMLDDGRVYADFISDIINNRNIVMKSDGSATRSFCYLADAVGGFFTVLNKGENGKSYNVGDQTSEISIADLANMLINIYPQKGLKVVKQEEKIFNGYIKSKISRACPDTTRICSLGWLPRHDIKTGFAKTIKSYES